MYEELAKKLRRCGKGLCTEDCPDWTKENLYHTCQDELVLEAADAIEELSKPRWIPVTERLPEKRKWVLCRCEANIIEVLRWENNEWYHDPMHVYYPSFVTQWQPLPEPPKEEIK